MTDRSNVEVIRTAFDDGRTLALALAAAFVDDPEIVVMDAQDRYERMIPTMAYADNPAHPMAAAVFICNALLTLYHTLAERGVDIHAVGGPGEVRLRAGPGRL